MRSKFLRALLVSAAFCPSAVLAQDVVVAPGTTDTERKDVGGDDQVLIGEGAALSVDDTAIRWNQASSGLRIDNYGIIESVEDGGRAINAGGDDNVERSIVLHNHAGAIIRSEHDAFRIDVDATEGTIEVRNAGTILSTVEGQALDFDSLTGTPEARAEVTIINEAGGLIEALGADGIRPGADASVVNAGIIRSGGIIDDNNDGIDWQQHAGTVVNQAGGLIDGQRHGITSDIHVDVVNEEGGVIIGRNGSGIGSDGTGRVVNYGRITGAYVGEGEGDGDGVDIDFYGIVDNYGIIEGTGDGGGDGAAEGVLVTDGGFITNHEGATITGLVRGVTTGNGTLVRNYGDIAAIGPAALPIASDGIGGGGGATVFNAAIGTISGNVRGIFADGGFDIENEGLIHGDHQGVFLVGDYTNTVINSGTIESLYAGIQAQAGNNTVINSGTVKGDHYAILFQAGNNTLELREGSVLIGAVDGGAGTNLLRLTEGVVFDQAVNFQQLEVTGDALIRGDSIFDGTTIASGATLTLGEGGTAGSVGGPIANEGVLRLDRANELVLSAPISGTGSLVQAGSGSTTLTGDHSFSGDTRVAGGRLIVDGALSQSTVVLDGGMLGGSGSVAAIRSNGGIIAPGNSIGQLAVAGDLVLAADDIYQVEVDASGASDQLVVGGQAVLNGAGVQVLAEDGSYRYRTDYNILTADGGVVGTFGSVESNLAFLDPTLVYGANDVALVLTRNDIDFATVGATDNQRAVGAVVQALGTGNALFEEALYLTDAEASAAFGNLSGEIYAGVGAGLVENARTIQRQLLTRPASGRDGLYGWGNALGSWGHADATTRNERFETEQLGLLGGIGYRANGFDLALGGGVSESDFEGLGTAEVTSTIIAATAGYDRGGVFLRAGASYAWNDGSTRRTARIGELGGDVSGDIDGNTQQFFGKIGYSAAFGGLEVTPFLGLNHIRVDTDALVEEGGATVLALAEDKRNVTYSNLGIALATAPVSRAGGMSIRPFASAAWRHGDGDTEQAYRADLDGSSFAVTGPALAEDAAEVAAGLDLTSGALRINAGYEGLLSNRWTQHSARIAATIAF